MVLHMRKGNQDLVVLRPISSLKVRCNITIIQMLMLIQLDHPHHIRPKVLNILPALEGVTQVSFPDRWQTPEGEDCLGGLVHIIIPHHRRARIAVSRSKIYYYLDNLTLLRAARRAPDSAITAIPRGPPRKPKQSGHALWVGNLPPGASILALKDHFSRDAKREIESLFLISKSNCAFVNYRTEEACERAVARFHDSRFQGVRLVCRLRKTSSAAPGAPAGPSSMMGAKAIPAPSSKSPVDDDTEDEDDEDDEDDEEEDVPESVLEKAESPLKSSERYFIVKSLTLQDLEQSVRNGIWATQSHNEDALNKAYSVSPAN
jgi:YT521-B-like domain-containing protein/RNA recognition motif-containing protein